MVVKYCIVLKYGVAQAFYFIQETFSPASKQDWGLYRQAFLQQSPLSSPFLQLSLMFATQVPKHFFFCFIIDFAVFSSSSY